ncbi:14490_t:CDS:2, partial [Racocetra persica]
VFKTRDRDSYSKVAQEVESCPETKEKKKPKKEAMSVETPNKQEIKDIFFSITDEIEDIQKEAEQTTTFSEAELITRDELSFKNNNKENNSSQENISS